jgi:hypothetical protein
MKVFCFTIFRLSLFLGLILPTESKANREVSEKDWVFLPITQGMVDPFLGLWERISPDLELDFSDELVFGKNIKTVPADFSVAWGDKSIGETFVLWKGAKTSYSWIAYPEKLGRTTKPEGFQIQFRNITNYIEVLPGPVNYAILWVRPEPSTTDPHHPDNAPKSWRFAGLYKQKTNVTKTQVDPSPTEAD